MTDRQKRILSGLRTLYATTYGEYDRIASQVAEIYRIGETSEEHPLIQKKRAVEDRLGNIAFRLSLAESYTRLSHRLSSFWLGATHITIRYTVDRDGTIFCQGMTPQQLAAFQAYETQVQSEEGEKQGSSLTVLSDTASLLWDSFLETLPIPDENTEENN